MTARERDHRNTTASARLCGKLPLSIGTIRTSRLDRSKRCTRDDLCGYHHPTALPSEFRFALEIALNTSHERRDTTTGVPRYVCRVVEVSLRCL